MPRGTSRHIDDTGASGGIVAANRRSGYATLVDFPLDGRIGLSY